MFSFDNIVVQTNISLCSIHYTQITFKRSNSIIFRNPFQDNSITINGCSSLLVYYLASIGGFSGTHIYCFNAFVIVLIFFFFFCKMSAGPVVVEMLIFVGHVLYRKKKITYYFQPTFAAVCVPHAVVRAAEQNRSAFSALDANVSVGYDLFVNVYGWKQTAAEHEGHY